jgi:sugar phosphate isomerase/epimerase
MRTNRRDLLKLAAAAGGAAVTFAGTARAVTIADPPQPARLRLSCQESVAPGKTLTEKLDFLEAEGFEGIEPSGRGLAGRIDEFKQALQGRKIKISAICSGYEGVLISEQEEVRKKTVASMKEILTAAGALGATGMIMVPAFTGQTKLGHWESREVLLSLLPELAEHAQQAGTSIILEPLNRREAHFLRQVPDAAAICRDVNHPGVRVMGDFWHMTWEETNDMAAFLAAGDYLRHVHMASRKTRKMPGDDGGDNYVLGFKGLKLLGYPYFVSLECGSKGDRMQSIPVAVKLLREQWETA